MASWQARIVQFMLRRFFKRATKIPIDPIEARRRVLPARLSKKQLARISACRLGAVPGERVDPPADVQASADIGVLYLHGGGYFFCSPQTHRPLTLGLSAALAAPLWAPDYRLAPESPYPAAVDDALEAYAHLLATEPGRRWVLAGDSAGGGLALALAGRIRDRGLKAPVALALYSPWTDLTCSGESLAFNSRSCSIFSEASVRDGARFYPGTTPPEHPEISPLFAPMAGLPPMIVFAAQEEALLDDSTRLVARARAAGVEVRFECVGGVPHAWPIFQRFMPEGRAALRTTTQFVAARRDAVSSFP